MRVAPRFCLNLLPDRPAEEYLSWWRGCDAGGVDYVGIADSPSFLPEMVVTGTRAALELSTTGIMTAVTNPLTRDPSVLASALLALDDLAAGGVVCGLGTGDSALWTVGIKRATVAHTQEYVVALRALLAGREASYQGRSFRLVHEPKRHVPVLVAGTGPRVIKMAAQHADGLILATGFSANNRARVQGMIDAACAEVGRDPAELQVWWQTTINFAPTVEEGMQRALGLNTSWMTADGKAGAFVPEELRASLERFNRDMEDLGSIRAGERGPALVERAHKLGLAEWLYGEAPGLWGPPEAIAAKLVEYAGSPDGVISNWQFYVSPDHGERGEYVRRFTDEVLPAVRGAGVAAGTP